MTIVGPKKAVAFKVRLPVVTEGSDDWKTSPTIAVGDWKIAKDGGALANLATLPTVAPAASAWVLLDLSATEMNADVVQLQGIDQTSPKEWKDTGAVIYTTAQGAGADAGTEIADALLDRANGVETGITPRQAFRAIGAAAAGKVSGAGSGSEVFKGLDGSTTRFTSTVDGDGNRSAVTLALS